MKKTITLLIVALLLISCEGLLEKTSYEKGFERLIKNITKEQKGKVVKVFSPRVKMKSTHFVLNTGDTIIPSNNEIMSYLQKGDKIIKKKSDNIISIFKSDSLFKSTWLYKIPKKYREDKRFPREWNGKWEEATNNF